MSKRQRAQPARSASASDEAMEEDKQPSAEGDALSRSFESVASKRGRPAIPEQWTGIVEVEPGDQLIPVRIRQIAADLALDNAMPSAPRSVRGGAPWAMEFHPETYWENHQDMTLENCELRE